MTGNVKFVVMFVFFFSFFFFLNSFDFSYISVLDSLIFNFEKIIIRDIRNT